MTDREQLADLLPELVRTLQRSRDAAGEAQLELVARFLDGLVTVGRALTAAPELRREADVELFLQESGTQLAFLHPEVDHYRAMTVHRSHGGWEGGEWEVLLRHRSALQFTGELYDGTDYEGFFALLDLDGLDEVIRDRGRSEGFPPSHEVPGGIPTSHWWWWYPSTPPGR